MWNDDFKLLSIGTGFKKNRIDGHDARDWGFLSWIKDSLGDILLDSPQNINDECCKEFMGDNYLRVNVESREFSAFYWELIRQIEHDQAV